MDLSWDLIGRRNRIAGQVKAPDAPAQGGLLDALLVKFRPATRLEGGPQAAADVPSMLDVLTTSLNIMQVRITNSRLAGEPADAVIRPRLSDIAAMDFHRGAVAIAEGERAAEQALPLIQELIG